MPSPGDILLFYHPHGIAMIIAWLTRSQYYHVAIAIDADQLIEAMPNGVRKGSLAQKRGERFHIIAAPSKKAALAAVAWAGSKVGDGYDPGDLLAIALDRIFAHLHVHRAYGNRFTCAEFVAEAFKKAGVRLFADLDSEDVVPADFGRLLRARRARGKHG